MEELVDMHHNHHSNEMHEYLRGDALMLLQMSPPNFSAHPWVLPAADVTAGF